MKKLCALVLGLFAISTTSTFAQWDGTKPPTGPGPAVSADVRNNFVALQQTVGTTNLMADPTYLIWPAGDTAAPAHYSLTGAGVTIARAGSGLGDTNRKVGDFCAKITSGAGAIATIQQQLLPTAAFTRASFLQSQSVSAGAWIQTSSASSVRIGIADGVGSSTSSFAPGTSTWTWLTVTRTLNASATALVFYVEIASGTITGYVSGPTVVLGAVPPLYYQPAPQRYDVCRFYFSGNQATGTDKERCALPRPAIVKDVQLNIKTAPTTQALIVDVNTWDGAAFTSMFSTRPQIAAGAFLGAARPDTTYARRCVSAMLDTGAGAGTIISVDIDQVGSGTVGADLWIYVRYLTYARPLEEFLGYNDVS